LWRGLALSFVKKSQLKNFCDLKIAGGCGVVPFLSVMAYFTGEAALH
jgi:hypothetical protein